ncbi:hypothetical protein [Rhodovastum atsumiense]|uniref:SRPBCC family protein n=1 Tax=Rhodovastum atsumiense TaxID=504468 RepID=A0A5M6IM33_9PROT|nr:hypothetical protein [Rhodovastum atsumiense]KAA5609353.1 hypothetical protein F1189_24460 [Rhodovastum atsumiense]
MRTTRRMLLASALLPVMPRMGIASGNDPAEVEIAGLRVPAARARVLCRFPLGGVEAACLAFAADRPEAIRDLLAVAAPGRLVALETLSWRGEDGSRMATRVSAVPDGRHLRLERTLRIPAGRAVQRESWTDYLVWRNDAPMEDAPVRPVLPGTWQAMFSLLRARTRTMLVQGGLVQGGLAQAGGLSGRLVAACPAPEFRPCRSPGAARLCPGL